MIGLDSEHGAVSTVLSARGLKFRTAHSEGLQRGLARCEKASGGTSHGLRLRTGQRMAGKDFRTMGNPRWRLFSFPAFQVSHFVQVFHGSYSRQTLPRPGLECTVRKPPAHCSELLSWAGLGCSSLAAEKRHPPSCLHPSVTRRRSALAQERACLGRLYNMNFLHNSIRLKLPARKGELLDIIGWRRHR